MEIKDDIIVRLRFTTLIKKLTKSSKASISRDPHIFSQAIQYISQSVCHIHYSLPAEILKAALFKWHEEVAWSWQRACLIYYINAHPTPPPPSQIHSEESLVNLERGRDCFVGLSMLTVYDAGQHGRQMFASQAVK